MVAAPAWGRDWPTGTEAGGGSLRQRDSWVAAGRRPLLVSIGPVPSLGERPHA